jgi:hypothetical protein
MIVVLSNLEKDESIVLEQIVIKEFIAMPPPK